MEIESHIGPDTELLWIESYAAGVVVLSRAADPGGDD